MAFPATYPIKPIHPSPRVRWQNGNMNVTRQFMVPAENVEQFYEDLLNGGNACGLPTSFPGWPLVLVDSIDSEPMNPCKFVTPAGEGKLSDPSTELEGYPSLDGSSLPATENEYSWWRVTVTYVTRNVLTGQDGVREGTWVTYERNVSGQIVRIPNTSLFFLATGECLKFDSGAHTLRPHGDIIVRWNFIDEADLAATEQNLMDLVGKVNDDAYGAVFFPGSATDVFEPETLQFVGYSTSLEAGTRSLFGTYCTAIEQKRTLVMQFKYNRVDAADQQYGGWNHRWYDGFAITPGWYRTSNSPTSDIPAYPLADFQTLFV